jgi:hypothetical protein
VLKKQSRVPTGNIEALGEVLPGESLEKVAGLTDRKKVVEAIKWKPSSRGRAESEEQR